MTVTEDNKLLTRKFYEEVVARGRVDLLDTLASTDIFDHAAKASGWAPGRAGFVQHIEWLHGGVSEPTVTIEDLIAEGDRVVAYWTLSGTHSGDFCSETVRSANTWSGRTCSVFFSNSTPSPHEHPAALGNAGRVRRKRQSDLP